MSNYFEILTNLGYKLIDNGNHWRTNALFRGGDNETSLKIYKDTGVCIDYVEGNSFPFKYLYRQTTGKDFDKSNLEIEPIYQTYESKLLKQEKTFPEESLKKLLPDYTYFEKRGIGEETQRIYKCGLATSGKFYQRIVFPIYRFDGKIHGFSGRKVLDDNENKVKWLHHGNSASWFYPYFTIDDVREQAEEEQRLFIIESIGDSMSLYQNGIKNNLVSFTNKVTNKFLSKICNFNGDLILSYNNDSDKKQNRGFDGALSSLLKMIDLIDLDRIWFFPPTKTDFGEMTDEEIKKWRRELDFSKESHKNCIKRLIDYEKNAILPKTLRPKIKKLKNEWRFRYEDSGELNKENLWTN